MSSGDETFCAAVNCMDGRFQTPVIDYLRSRFSAQHVDMITEPGPIKILAERKPEALVDSIRARLDISVNRHGARSIAIIGHEDCAGNPVAKNEQLEQLAAAQEIVQGWYPGVSVIRLWVDLAGQAEDLC